MRLALAFLTIGLNALPLTASAQTPDPSTPNRPPLCRRARRRSTTCPASSWRSASMVPGWAPGLRKSENRFTAALLVKFW